ncbi:MAG: CYTH domain-containing protein, partial [Alphaproteobacteria bacterium]|nr:CYTH domain-containing protein [Alphaproteobacteria bacterium]
MTATQRQSAEARLANAPPPAASPAGAHEHELRFRIDPAKVSGLLDLPLLKQAGPPRELELLNTYFDTAGVDLARAGCSLRIRHGQGRLQQTLKVPSRAGIAHGLKLELERVTATAKPV